MRKVLAISLVSVSVLGLTAGQAAAWWFPLFKPCCKTVHCKQYNAFSPFCCDDLQGCAVWPHAVNAYAGAGYPHANFIAGEGGYLGELPAVGNSGVQGDGTIVTPPPTSAPAPSTGKGTPPAGSAHVLPPGTTPQTVPAVPIYGRTAPTWPAWGPGMVNPSGVPSFYPNSQGFGPNNAGIR
jgi:hypothetical protein